MMSILRFIYSFFLLPIFIAAIWIASFFNDKIRRGIKARKNLSSSIKERISLLPKGKKRIWFHSSSMGEFEQAKPIIEKLKNETEVQIIVSFFSPSGYENSKNYSYADFVTYIPLDTKQKCRSFLNELKVDAAVFMRYDIWPNMIYELSEQKIPILLVDATMRYNSPRKYGLSKIFHHHLYNKIDRILTVSKDDLKNFLVFNLDESKLKTVGDTRFDRVYQKSIQAKDKKLFKDDFFENQKVLVIGSAWEADEEILLAPIFKLMKIHPEFKVIIAPHEPTVQHLERLEQKIDPELRSIRFSYMNNYKNQRIILIDSIGILLSLYFYADISYVGGGFKAGVHNVLEPAVYGLPVLFGPKIQNSQESLKLIEEGSGRVIHDTKQAYKIIKKLLVDDSYRKELGTISSNYVKANIGATTKIIEEISKFI